MDFKFSTLLWSGQRGFQLSLRQDCVDFNSPTVRTAWISTISQDSADFNPPTVRTAWISTLPQSGQFGFQLSYSKDSVDFKSFMSGQRRFGLPADQSSADFNFLLARIARISTPSPDRTARAFV